MRALAVLSVMDGQVIGQLAVHAIVEQSTLSRAIDALEADGMVRRAADGADSRLVRVFITDAGRSAFDALWPHMAGTYANLFAGIDAQEQRAFVATLQKIHVNTGKVED
jgi:DNA-binding MarR family transcriptional regulator